MCQKFQIMKINSRPPPADLVPWSNSDTYITTIRDIIKKQCLIIVLEALITEKYNFKNKKVNNINKSRG